MEFRSREKAIRMPNSFDFSYPAQNQESSSAKQLNLAAATATATATERGEEAGGEDHDAVFTSPTDNHHHHQEHHNQSFQVQSHPPPPSHVHQQNTHRTRIDPGTQNPSTSATNRSSPHPNLQQDASPSNAIIAAATTSSIHTSSSMVRYRECLRNHAAHLAGHVVDGCGEFMPGGAEGTPEYFKCAACDCHRNFHRKEIDGEPLLSPLPPMTTGANCYISYHPSKPIPTKPLNMVSPAHQVPPTPHHIPPQPPTHHHHHHHHQQQQQQRVSSTPAGALAPYHPTMMTFGGGAPSESSSEDLNIFRGGSIEGRSSSKKRFRTKFSQEQKEKMMEFAEKLGWRIQKQDEVEVQQFCDESGVKRQVFKVWMHNNKQAMKRKQS